MKTIVTHPGSAHRDEFIACCLLVYGEDILSIHRRDATTLDLACDDFLVLDQGGQHETEEGNFDHHQLPRDAEPTCTITLVLPYLKIDPDTARRIWVWLEFSEWLDSKGPFQTAEHYGMARETLLATVSPIETTVLRWFEEHDKITPEDAIWALMYRIGREKTEYLQQLQSRLRQLRDGVTWLPVRDHYVLDARCIPRDNEPVMGLELFVSEEPFDCPVTITNDDRGDGVCLFRRNDDPRYDFSRLAGRDGVVFAHKGGFVAKLAAGVAPLPLLLAAIVDEVSLKERVDTLNRLEELTNA